MIISHKDLPSLRQKFKDKRVIFCSGVFDLTHAGHTLFLEECKKFGDVLVVSVGSDAGIKEYKGNERPILNEHLRLKMVSSLKPVSYSFIEPKFPNGDMFKYLEMVFRELKPDVFVINEDAPGIPRTREILKKFGKIEFKILKRSAPPEFEEISTSNIIKKIKNLS